MNYGDPYFTLQSSLTRMAADIERYCGKGRVRELADRAEALVRQLAPPTIPPTFGDGSFSTGLSLPYIPRHVDSRAAENACKDLAEELNRVRQHAEGGRKGKAKAEAGRESELRDYRKLWEKYRRGVEYDTEADQLVALDGELTSGAFKQRRLRAEKKEKWRRP